MFQHKGGADCSWVGVTALGVIDILVCIYDIEVIPFYT